MKKEKVLDTIKEYIINENKSKSEFINFCQAQDAGIFDNIENFEYGHNIKPYMVFNII